MYIVKSLLITIFIFISSNSFSQNHSKIESDLERVKKDIIDLQKFVYQNKSNLDGTGGETTIHFIDITGYNERIIPTPRDGSDPAWSPLL